MVESPKQREINIRHSPCRNVNICYIHSRLGIYIVATPDIAAATDLMVCERVEVDGYLGYSVLTTEAATSLQKLLVNWAQSEAPPPPGPKQLSGGT